MAVNPWQELTTGFLERTNVRYAEEVKATREDRKLVKAARAAAKAKQIAADQKRQDENGVIYDGAMLQYELGDMSAIAGMAAAGMPTKEGKARAASTLEKQLMGMDTESRMKWIETRFPKGTTVNPNDAKYNPSYVDDGTVEPPRHPIEALFNLRGVNKAQAHRSTLDTTRKDTRKRKEAAEAFTYEAMPIEEKERKASRAGYYMPHAGGDPVQATIVGEKIMVPHPTEEKMIEANSLEGRKFYYPKSKVEGVGERRPRTGTFWTKDQLKAVKSQVFKPWIKRMEESGEYSEEDMSKIEAGLKNKDILTMSLDKGKYAPEEGATTVTTQEAFLDILDEYNLIKGEGIFESDRLEKKVQPIAPISPTPLTPPTAPTGRVKGSDGKVYENGKVIGRWK